MDIDSSLSMLYKRPMIGEQVVELSTQAVKEFKACQIIVLKLLNQQYSKEVTVHLLKAIRDTCTRALDEMDEMGEMGEKHNRIEERVWREAQAHLEFQNLLAGSDALRHEGKRRGYIR